MFSNKEEDTRINEISNSSNTISKDTSIDGNVETTGNLRIEGKVKGNIRARSKVVLGNSGEVEGKVFAQTADVEGTINGSVQVEGLLTLKSTAHIKGDIKTGKLVMEAGAVFDGKCKMGSFKNPDDLTAVQKQPEKVISKPTDKPQAKITSPTLSSTEV
jgi:cytoskeletal protein CcmA (bactofilin family)